MICACHDWLAPAGILTVCFILCWRCPVAAADISLPVAVALFVAAAAASCAVGAGVPPGAVAARRTMCEWLRTDAISKGLAAAATGGARAAVVAAVAAERHEVGRVVVSNGG